MASACASRALLSVQRELESGKLVAPFGRSGPRVQAYAFNVLKSKVDLPKVRRFQDWLFSELDDGRAEPGSR